MKPARAMRGPVVGVHPKLIAITDAAHYGVAPTIERWRSIAGRAAPGSVAIQLRDPALDGGIRYELGLELRGICQNYQQVMIINDRLDLAFMLGASGVHLGRASTSLERVVELASQLGRPRPWISMAIHDLSALPPSASQADAWLLSPIFAPRKGRSAVGVEALELKARGEARLTAPPVFALGGIGPANASACLSAGAAGVAAVQAVFGPQADYLALLEALEIRC